MQLEAEYTTRAPGIPPRGTRPHLAVVSLGRVIADLTQLNQDTEREFLSIGGKLTEFMQVVSAISSDLATLADSGRVERVSQALTHAVHTANEMRSTHADGDGDLTDMRKEAGALKRALNGFDRTVSTFHTLALMTRIETARIGDAGEDFKSVADDVSGLAGQIQSRVGTAMAIADSLIPSIERATREISALETTHAKDLPALASRSLASLASMRQMQDKAQESSKRLKSQYGAISSSFNKLIVSIQFHDITRQQIEHVIEVLQRLCIPCDGDDDGISSPPRGMSAVLALQSAQLADAGKKFATSVIAVERSIEEIGRHVVEMSGESRALSGIAEGGQGSMFLSVEQDFPAILTSLNQTAINGSLTRDAQQGLRQIIAQMHEPIHEIQKLELEMRRIALNAQISACTLGSAGIALDVLAGSVQQLASECRDRSESLSSTSWAVNGERRKQEHDSSGGARATDSTMQELRLAIEDMHSSSQRGFGLIQQIVARGESLAAELVAAHDGFSAGRLFAKAIQGVQGAMADIEENAKSGISQAGTNEPKTVYAELANHYTMKAERDVHDALTRENAASVQEVTLGKESAASVEEVDELGGSVEFF